MNSQLKNLVAALLVAIMCTAPSAKADVGWARIDRKEDSGYVEKAKAWFSSKWTTVKAYLPKQEPKPIVHGGTNPPPAVANNASTTSRAPGSVPHVAPPSTPAVTNIPRSSTGVAVYKILPNVDSVPRLDIGSETRMSAAQWAVTGKSAALIPQIVTARRESPPLMTQPELLALTKLGPKPTKPLNISIAMFDLKASRAEIEKINMTLKPENQFNLAQLKELTVDEVRFLSGLLLYQQGDKCAAAVGLFHNLAKMPKYEAEGNYYLAMCSKKLTLITDFIERSRRVIATQDAHYMAKILPEVSPDLPYELAEPFGETLLAVANAGKLPALNPTVSGNVNFIVANYGAQTGNWKVAQTYAAQVNEKHEKWPQARFLTALAEYQIGNKSKALTMQAELVKKLDADKTRAEFQGVVTMNLARMYFQEQKFKESREWFQRVYKDHPLWLQGLQEMGWAQLQSNDFEGAIGNMYSVQSPYFSAVYKPESYVIRTIGYLNLCQYGDAYRTLSGLEHTYRPWLAKMDAYQKSKPDYFGTIRKFMTSRAANGDIDGIPAQVVREMVRHRDYTALQKSLNRQVDEQAFYANLDKEVEKALAKANWMVSNSRKRGDDLRAKIASIKTNPQLEQNRLQWNQELENETHALNGYTFTVELFSEAKASLKGYKADMIANADKRIDKMRNRIVNMMSKRIERMRADLKLILENNELLRYEAFAGSGENIRYQVAGGQKANRVPAEVVPQSKSLQWNFDGEYWEDEIGNYRSSLKNNCPDSKTAGL